MIDWLRLSLRPHFHVGWNLFLAIFPFALSLWLFRRTDRRSWLWWLVLVIFVLFLPNAAYTLTDVVHFVSEVRASQPELPTWSVVYVVIPKYTIFMFFGFQCHVISLIRVGSYLRWIGRHSWIFAAEMALNLLCSIGIYWGRYLRLNSWDIVSMPQAIAHETLETLFRDEFAHKVILVYFLVITAMYFFLKAVDLAVWEYWQRHRIRGGFTAESSPHAHPPAH